MFLTINLSLFLSLTMRPQSWAIMATICASLVQACLTVDPLSKADKILSLPGQPRVSFQQFSGYVTVDEKQQRALFYYFVEAETSPASKPLVLWLNGGPGCSSVGAGAFVEHGPFKPGGRSLIRNYYSWNKEANLLYLDSPAGVGFSYSTNKSFYSYVNDQMTAQDNFQFLKHWFVKFPEYKSRELFITGESYAGHYVPQLAQLIVQSDMKFNLKGIAIGNPLLEYVTDFNSRAAFLWSHGLISDLTFELFTFSCNYSRALREASSGSITPICLRVISQVSKEIGRSIDPYGVTLDVCLSSSPKQLDFLSHPILFPNLLSVNLQSQAQEQAPQNLDVCITDKTVEYLNQKDVQKALHAQLKNVASWTLCSNVLGYDSRNLEIPTIEVVGSLVKSGIRVLVYSGDQDAVIPLLGTRTLVDRLASKLGLNTTVPYRSWFEGKQVGGWTQVYGDNILSFASIRGASHTAPHSQPKRSLALFAAFLEGEPLPGASING